MPLADLWESLDVESEQENEKRLKNQQRTAKARSAAAKAREKRKLDLTVARVEEKVEDTRQGDLQAAFFSRKLFHSSTEQDRQRKKLDRARCLYSFLLTLLKIIQDLFQRDQIEHVINCVIADDTTTRMKPPSGRSQIFTVCNTVQSLHIRYSNDSCRDCPEREWQTLQVPSPMVALSGAKAGDVHGAMTAFSVFCAQGIGFMLSKLGLTKESVTIPQTGFRTQVFCGDALRANDAAWIVERSIRMMKKQQSEDQQHDESQDLSLRLKCMVHQLNLIRKPCVLSAKGYWSTLVRMAHMMEQASFRRAFASAMLVVLQAPNMFQRA